MKTRECSICGETKSLTSEYFERGSGPNRLGFLAWCLVCARRERTKANRGSKAQWSGVHKRRRKAAGPKFSRTTPAVWRSLLEAYDHKCAYCKMPPDGSLDRKLTKDHFAPLCRGGTDSPFNVVVACHKCNREKHWHDPFEWLRERFGSHEFLTAVEACLPIQQRGHTMSISYKISIRLVEAAQ